jgi:hypothetical protein
MFLCNKLDLDKLRIIQKYYCHKVPNQHIYIITLSPQSNGSVPFEFEFFLKTLVREIEVNRLDKISLIRTFVLFFKKNL